MIRMYTKSTSSILYSFFRYKRILTREITSESSLRPPFWFCHLCCDITNGISAHQKSKTSLGPLQARVLSSFLQEYFLVLTMLKWWVVGSTNNFLQRKIRRKNSAPVDNFVQVKRADFLEPKEHSIICGTHFANECFEDDGMVKMGSKIKEAISKAVGSPQFSHSDPKHCLKHVVDYG